MGWCHYVIISHCTVCCLCLFFLLYFTSFYSVVSHQLSVANENPLSVWKKEMKSTQHAKWNRRPLKMCIEVLCALRLFFLSAGKWFLPGPHNSRRPKVLWNAISAKSSKKMTRGSFVDWMLKLHAWDVFFGFFTFPPGKRSPVLKKGISN